MESRNRVERCLDLIYGLQQWDPFFSWVCVVGGSLMFAVSLPLGIFGLSIETDFGLLPTSAFMAMFSLLGAANLLYENYRTLATTMRLFSVVAYFAAIILFTLKCYSLFGFYVASILFATFVVFFGSVVFYRYRRTQ